MGWLADSVTRKISSTKTNNSLVAIYDAMMLDYGWIPPDEFLKLPQSLINNLLIRINKRRENDNKNAHRTRR